VAIVGAKLFYLIENGLPLTQLWSSRGFRMPGGFLALAVTFVGLCRVLAIPVLGALDAIAPGLALVIVIGRIGCFLQGCCFGIPTDLPWAVVFPADSPAHQSHQAQHLLPHDAVESLPVHPLSLYFSIDALAILLFLLWLARRASYPGQVILWFVVLRTWSKTALEPLRGYDIGSGINRSGEAEFWIALLATAALITITSVRAVQKRNGRHPLAMPPVQR
jgi:phosphatidylglycerol:prolipoprotein diacylglycerol transferase